MMNASISLLHVFSLLDQSKGEALSDIHLNGISTLSLSGTDFDTWKRKAQISEIQLKTLVQEIRQEGVRLEGLHLLGPPGPVICESAEKQKADVIMIGRRAENQGLDRTLGSVSHFVVYHAPCSVWIFPDDD